MKQLTSNEDRAYAMVEAFTNDIPWKAYTESFDNMKHITKADVAAYAKQWFGNDYAVVYKHQDPNFRIPPFSKPTITPVTLDPNSKSDFFKQIESNKVTPIEPVFTDYASAITKSEINGIIPMLYVQNNQNSIFTLYYVFDQGTLNDRRLPIAFDYLDYLGTADLTPAQVKQKLLTMACSFSVVPQAEKTFVILTGLSENMKPAMELVDQLLTNPRPDAIAFSGVVANELKGRADSKLDFNTIASRLTNYGFYGPKSPATYVLSDKELADMSSDEAIEVIKQANNYKYEIWYYGPGDLDQVIAQIKQTRTIPAALADAPAPQKFEMKPTEGGQVFLVDYPSKQTSVTLISRGVQYDPSLTTAVRLYNDYFSTTAFQELREARGLAYSVYSLYGTPTKGDEYYCNRSFIGTQNDKLPSAVARFREILTDMPSSSEAFAVTKLNVENAIRTNRVLPSDLLWSYYRLRRLGLSEGLDKQVFDELPTFSFYSLEGFHDQYIKNAKYDCCLVGNSAELDMNYVNSIGKVTRVKLEDIFGY
jgi:predicted Zn-dependent peptidase